MHNACNEFQPTSIVRSCSLQYEKEGEEEEIVGVGQEKKKAKLKGYRPDHRGEELSKQLPFVKRLKIDRFFREDVEATVYLCGSFFFLGWALSQLGPTFPDIMAIVGTSLESSTPMFTAGTLGYLLGSLIMGMLFDRLNKIMLVFSSIVGMALAVIALPWCAPYPSQLAARFGAGFFGGSLDTGANAGLAFVWGGEGRTYMQAMHFAYALGGTISPFVTDPFLAKETEGSRLVLTPSNTTNSSVDVGTTTSLGLLRTTENVTISSDGEVVEHFQTFTETRVQFAFLITGVLGILASIPFMYMYCIERYKQKEEDYEPEIPVEKPCRLSLPLKASLLVVLFTMFVFTSAVEDTFANLLMTFCIQQLGWQKTRGSLATAVFWAFFGLGRFAGIFTIRHFKLNKLIFVFSTCATLSFLALFLASYFSVDWLVWICIACVGWFESIIFPSMFSFTEERVMPVSSAIASSFLIACSLGASINPFFMGYLMENVSPLWYVYVLLGESALVLALYTLVNIIAYFFIPKEEVSPEGDGMLAAGSPPSSPEHVLKPGVESESGPCKDVLGEEEIILEVKSLVPGTPEFTEKQLESKGIKLENKGMEGEEDKGMDRKENSVQVIVEMKGEEDKGMDGIESEELKVGGNGEKQGEENEKMGGEGNKELDREVHVSEKIKDSGSPSPKNEHMRNVGLTESSELEDNIPSPGSPEHAEKQLEARGVNLDNKGMEKETESSVKDTVVQQNDGECPNGSDKTVSVEGKTSSIESTHL